MMTWSESRLTVEGVKSHPFFYGADWESLRYIAPPFVPALQSITDTTYFPTDDLGNLPDQLETLESLGSEKDLAFIGCVSFLLAPTYPATDIVCAGLHSSALLAVSTHEGWRILSWIVARTSNRPFFEHCGRYIYNNGIYQVLMLTSNPVPCFRNFKALGFKSLCSQTKPDSPPLSRNRIRNTT